MLIAVCPVVDAPAIPDRSDARKREKARGTKAGALLESYKSFDNIIVEQGFNPELDIQVAEQLAEVYQRSRTSSINSLLRLMNMFERLERMTNGEQVPAPLAVDISLNVEEPSRSKSTTLDLERRDEQMVSLEGQHSSSRLANRSIGSPHIVGPRPGSAERSEQPTASSVETEIDAILGRRRLHKHFV